MLQLAEVLARHWPAYLQEFEDRIPAHHRRAVASILACRTPALGGHVYGCSDCGQSHFAYHSCNHRCCPRCGHHENEHWVQVQKTKLLPVSYFLVTFTLPEELRLLARSDQNTWYHQLFCQSALTLQEVAAKPKYLGAELGFWGVLHTWSRQLHFHPHVHYVVPAGGLAPNRLRWIGCKNHAFFLPERVLARRFRNRLRVLIQNDPIHRQSVGSAVWKKEWVVDVLPVGTGEAVLQYLANYVHKTALTSQRIVADHGDHIEFLYRDSADKKIKKVTVTPHEFLRRFLQHVLPSGFQRVRYFGWLAPAAKFRRERVLALFDWTPPPKPQPQPLPQPQCPHCGKPMLCLGKLIKKPP